MMNNSGKDANSSNKFCFVLLRNYIEIKNAFYSIEATLSADPASS
jgi:hypothetical protein